MQLGFVSAILAEIPLEDLFRFAAAEKFDCIELMCWPPGKAERRYAGVTHVDCTSLDEAQAQRIRALATETGVAISGLGYYPNVLSPDPAEAAVCTDHLRKVIEAAPRLGVRQVNTFIGRDWRKTVEDNWPRFLEVWRPLLGLAEKEGVRIGIENCPMYFTRDEWPGGKNLATCPAIWRRMFSEIPSPAFGLNFDPSHLVWQQMDYLKPLAEFAGRIFHVHAKDAHLDRARLNDVGLLATPLEFHDPRLPGLGDIDWAAFLAALARAGYDGPVAIEVEDRRFEGSLASRQQALRQSAAYLRPLMSQSSPLPSRERGRG
jgi:sugar phosphate isomerase/epimerase